MRAWNASVREHELLAWKRGVGSSLTRDGDVLMHYIVQFRHRQT